MSLNLEMLQVAGLAPRILNDASENVIDFIHSQFDPDSGGYKGRDGKPDIYYTIFALSCLRALKAPLKSIETARFLEQLSGEEEMDKMDFVSLSSLARAYTLLPEINIPSETRAGILSRLDAYKAKDGAWHNFVKDHDYGTPYGSFLAIGCLQDLGESLPEKAIIIGSIKKLEREPGTYANDEYSKQGTTTVSAAAQAIFRLYNEPINKQAAIASILKLAYSKGGFFASSMTPMPDLLSTATALHALSGLDYDFGDIKELQLDYIDTLWSSRGGFHGNWADNVLDCEYTFYGLLALGHLSY